MFIWGEWFHRSVGSAAGQLPLSPLADRCHTVYQLQSTIKILSLQAFQQSLAMVSQLHSTSLSSCLQLRGESLWCMPTTFDWGSSSCILPYNFHTLIASIWFSEYYISVSTIFTPSHLSMRSPAIFSHISFTYSSCIKSKPLVPWCIHKILITRGKLDPSNLVACASF